MASEFITRVERDKDEPYTVIFRTDDADKYKHIEDECRKMIGHAKPTEQPTVDAVPVVHGEWVFNGRFAELNHYACSNCSRTEFRMSDYCPNCGAVMDGKENNDG